MGCLRSALVACHTVGCNWLLCWWARRSCCCIGMIVLRLSQQMVPLHFILGLLLPYPILLVRCDICRWIVSCHSWSSVTIHLLRAARPQCCNIILSSIYIYKPPTAIISPQINSFKLTSSHCAEVSYRSHFLLRVAHVYLWVPYNFHLKSQSWL